MLNVTDSFFESRGAGDFSPLGLTLAMINAKPDVEFDRWHSLPEDERLTNWMNVSAYFHELRHYHDLVGSVCGFHTVLEGTALVDQFYDCLGKGSLSGAANLYSQYGEFFKVVMGDLPPQRTDEELKDDLATKFESTTPQVTTYYPQVLVSGRNPESGRRESLGVPLGLRALMEHIATEMQIVAAAVGAGEDPQDKLDPEGRVRRSHSLWASLFRARFHPYYIARLYASYARYESPGQSSRLLHWYPPMVDVSVLAQVAMDISGYARISGKEGEAPWEFEHPGQAFAHLLAAWAETDQRPDALAVANSVTERVMGKTYLEFLEQYAVTLENEPRRALPRHLLPESAQMPAVGKIRDAILADHADLIRTKIENPNLWFVPVDYLRNAGQLPKPPLQSVSYQDEMPRGKDLAVLFLTWSFLLSYMQGIAEGGDVSCPIAYRMPAIGDMVNFPDPQDPQKKTNCRPFIEASLCGRFNGRFLPTQPQCPFSEMTTHIAEQDNS